MTDPARADRQIALASLTGVPEIGAGADLAALIADLAGVGQIIDGDVVVITSKVVSKAEGRVVVGDREAAIDRETARLVARRGQTRIVQNRLGLIMAAAGVDASNVAPGSLVLLPEDPDASAREIREGLAARLELNVAVVITDTAGRPWRHGQTDIAIGLAGMRPLESLAGHQDPYGNPLAVTEPAIADELAAAAELAAGKLSGRPITIARGLGDRVLPRGAHGPGARALIRDSAEDMFGLGSREAVVAALAGADPAAFGAPAAPEDLVESLARCGFEASPTPAGVAVAAPPGDPRLAALAVAHGWSIETGGGPVHLVPGL